ncbi:hypothetical protein BDBG_16742 [Blastomyces gilchristii SLH14081]|uniref:Uncharacterized protein n=1 Tax=Blastomyces gilchristii (strain SLH14081) TaxID=559298 RepID=A0A179UI24_BLAGS|nr:uncharacterized protein BDBG_16742 [Blastomyces gilchristii SLH14081]OAT06908.1 hypothetical protein BDBG_16742 [Blastomyces gilchristii SLH14081]
MDGIIRMEAMSRVKPQQGLGAAGKYAKNKKISDFINLDKPDIFSELEEPLKPEYSEEVTAEAKIAYNIKITAWKIKYMKYKKLNKDMTKI